ncbi:DUF4291 domain-containing protein [Nocardia ninae]|uniref:DUF4291 domain-containing protein n=1 Tax=Nocardia ninae NBRC 108245 TaxID=1210091 RepID=A0A511MU85_9NOCA|nr:DUF4291 domain-containing protein [Nocardia ninae]GEM44153.1 hypothetical protein NN4_86720 [Nocardia ninae NBRC 108245]
MSVSPPMRQVRADYDAATVVVYQAYSAEIAEAAVAAGTFVAPFSRDRMTWIKPSFLWMMYRCGWGSKPGQERVLAVTITRSGFEWALWQSCLSHYVPDMYSDQRAWMARLRTSPVRVQWDPERDLHHRPLAHRSLQVGLGGPAVGLYVDRWITGIRDVTAEARRIKGLVADGKLDAAARALPVERPYPLPAEIARVIGAG